MNDAGTAFIGPATHAEFPSTQWSKILQAGAVASAADSPELEALCRAYWPPLYSFLRRQGHSPQDAEDLVQGFLARLLAREDLAEVGPEKGRFRTFLLTSLRNFVIKQALRDKALKRGGRQAAISIDANEAEAASLMRDNYTRHLLVEEGGASYVQDFEEAPDGIIWFGTQNGVLPSSVIHALFATSLKFAMPARSVSGAR